MKVVGKGSLKAVVALISPAAWPGVASAACAVITWVALALAGCDSRPTDPPPAGVDAASPIASSPVVLTIRPRGTFSGLAGVTSYDAVSTSGSVTLTPMTGAAERTFTTAGNGVILATAHEVGSTPYLILGVNDAQDVFHLQSVHDADGDGVLDPATLVTHFTTAPAPAYFTHMAVAGDAWYFLDRRCQDVRLATDADADGLPEVLAANPYARSADYAFLLAARSIGSTTEGEVLAAAVDLSAVPGHESGWAVYTDSDLDGVAEAENLEAARTLAPIVLGHPFAGQAKVYVHPGHGADKTAEVWLLDEDGEDDILLGSAALAPHAWGSIALAPALKPGTAIAVRFTAGQAAQREFDVEARLPQIYSTRPSSVSRAQHSTLALVGQGFLDGMVVKLRTAAGTLHVAAATVTDSEKATVTFPALQASDEGLALLWAVNVGDTSGPLTRTLAIGP